MTGVLACGLHTVIKNCFSSQNSYFGDFQRQFEKCLNFLPQFFNNPGENPADYEE